MAYSKKRLIAAAMAGVLAMMSAFPGYAASRKKITSVSVSIKADIEPETDFGQEIIEIESSSNRYSVDGYEILNEGFYWTEDMTPEIRITLTADDDYYFTALTKDKVTLKELLYQIMELLHGRLSVQQEVMRFVYTEKERS